MGGRRNIQLHDVPSNQAAKGPDMMLLPLSSLLNEKSRFCSTWVFATSALIAAAAEIWNTSFISINFQCSELKEAATILPTRFHRLMGEIKGGIFAIKRVEGVKFLIKEIAYTFILYSHCF